MITSPGQRSAVFFDRDGVLNCAEVVDGKPFPPRSRSDFEIVDDAGRVCHMLRQAGFVLIAVTNQPDIARGTTRTEEVEAIHAILIDNLELDDVLVCPHDDDDQCSCRKPAPGMLLLAAAKHNIDLGRSYLIGDRWRDIAAGKAAGCRSVFIDHQYAEAQPTSPDATVRSLNEAAAWILSAADEKAELSLD